MDWPWVLSKLGRKTLQPWTPVCIFEVCASCVIHPAIIYVLGILKKLAGTGSVSRGYLINVWWRSSSAQTLRTSFSRLGHPNVVVKPHGTSNNELMRIFCHFSSWLGHHDFNKNAAVKYLSTLFPFWCLQKELHVKLPFKLYSLNYKSPIPIHNLLRFNFKSGRTLCAPPTRFFPRAGFIQP